MSIPASADGTLTLDLPPSQNALDARASERAQQEAQAAKVRQEAAQRRLQSRSAGGQIEFGMRGALPSRGKRQTERVTGRLGQVAQAQPIYRSRTTHSARLTTAPAGTYMAIEDEAGGWYGVLMADGSIGWVPGAAVNLMDYQVVSSTPAPDSLPPLGAPDAHPRGDTPYFTGDPQSLFQEAYKYLGVRYVWGGNTYGGIDCSGFVRNVFAACGYNLPRTAAEQVAYGVPVPPDALQPGDRLYFGGRSITHTGLYLGDGYFIHSSSSRHGVAISRLGEPLYARIFVCARR